MTLTLTKKIADKTTPPLDPSTRPYRQSKASLGTAQGTSALLRRWRSLIDQALDRMLAKASEPPAIVHEGMRYCVFSGGKRFRPLLCLASAAAVGGSAKAALTTACAIELIHTYSLVHDDLPAMDNADERRGKPTCHRKFGEGIAILIGDALLTLAFEWLSHDKSPNAVSLVQVVSRACGTGGLIGGQVLDLQAISASHTSAEQGLREIARQKTGALITASVLTGGLTAHATATQLKWLKQFGHDLGLAFQLIDDIHDQEGLVTVLGLDEAIRQAQNLITRATGQLKSFGKSAKSLRDMAQWLAATR